jgi:hypothetical protein
VFTGLAKAPMSGADGRRTAVDTVF